MKKILLTLLVFTTLLKTYSQCDYNISGSIPNPLTLNNGDTLCVDADFTTSSSITVNNGGVIKISNNSTFTVTGSIAVYSGGKISFLDCDSRISVSGSYQGPYNECEMQVYCLPADAEDPLTFVGGSKLWNDWCPLNPLPVELIYFEAEKNTDERCIYYRWGTAAELNNHYFEILVSKDGQYWDSVAIVLGNGNSFEPIDYVHKSFELDYVYAKLKQVDFDGTTSYSNVTYLGPLDADVTFLTDRVIVRTKIEKQFKVYSITGKLLINKTIPVGTTVIKLNEMLSKGIVLVNIDEQTKKMIIK